MFMMRIGVMGLLLIIRIWRYCDIELGVGIWVLFLFVWTDMGIIASMLPPAEVGP